MPFPLADAIFWVAVACCTIAQLAILHSVFIARHAGSDSPTPSSSGRRGSEIAWAVLPAFALIAVFFYTWKALP